MKSVLQVYQNNVVSSIQYLHGMFLFSDKALSNEEKTYKNNCYILLLKILFDTVVMPKVMQIAKIWGKLKLFVKISVPLTINSHCKSRNTSTQEKLSTFYQSAIEDVKKHAPVSTDFYYEDVYYFLSVLNNCSKSSGFHHPDKLQLESQWGDLNLSKTWKKLKPITHKAYVTINCLLSSKCRDNLDESLKTVTWELLECEKYNDCLDQLQVFNAIMGV
jgi:hypothetical protein